MLFWAQRDFTLKRKLGLKLRPGDQTSFCGPDRSSMEKLSSASRRSGEKCACQCTLNHSSGYLCRIFCRRHRTLQRYSTSQTSTKLPVRSWLHSWHAAPPLACCFSTVKTADLWIVAVDTTLVIGDDAWYEVWVIPGLLTEILADFGAAFTQSQKIPNAY